MFRRRKMLAAVLVLMIPIIFCGADNVSEKPRLLIISIDGLRPDLMLRADTPVLHSLLQKGSFTCWAQTTAVGVTLPSHVSMLTGVKPQKHQIEWNKDLPFSRPVYPAVPTLFELAHKAGYTTGMVAGKSKFKVLNKPDTIDAVFVPMIEEVPDQKVLEEALNVIEDGPPEVLFIHLPEVDHVGHKSGWGTPEQLAAIANADSCVGKILDAMQAINVMGSTLLIVTSDHGGAGKTHGADDPRSRHIPWIAVGPGVKADVDLTIYADRTIRTEDTFATACSWLKIKPPLDIEGKPVEEIFDQRGKELMTDADPAPTTQATNIP
jgi:predicted AlkP superfamily pyrophosphatase or phosphodiesterase